MEDIKYLMKDNYLKYASYVILDRAIPHVIDGLKPVQRRILFTLFKMHDGKLHKVANVAGQTMAFHPHGDAAITDALINLANKGYLLDTQGNFGNIFTGDPAAASRYIETRLSGLAVETMFNPDITEMIASYDGRAKEPIILPAKIPMLLMQGAEGIAVGMSTRILPHNFTELLEAQIAILEGRDYRLYPDFPTGGIMDASDYDKGKGKVRLRAKLDVVDAKSLVIREICYGTTTESLIKSVEEAAKRGKIRIDSINDYTAEHVEIEIKMPRGYYANDLIKALYAYTECEVSLSSNIVVIKDNLPWEADINEILELNTKGLVDVLKRELEIDRDRLNEKIFQKSLEQIFIENRLYKKIETIASYDEIHDVVAKGLKPFLKDLLRIPTLDDREKLLNIPIRRISRFDLDKNQKEILDLQNTLQRVEKNLKNLKGFTIKYLKDLVKKYGSQFIRKTKIEEIEQVDLREIATRQLTVGFDVKSGFVGTKIKADTCFECTNFDKILLMFSNGSYKVISIPEKLYVEKNNDKIVYVGVADKETVLSVVYMDPKSNYCYAKRFIVQKFILDKEYSFMEEGMSLQFLSTEPKNVLEIGFIPKPKQKIAKLIFDMDSVLVKGVSSKGTRIANRQVKKNKSAQRMMVNKRITWEASRDVRNAISIFVDGEFWKEVHAPIFKKKLSFPKSIRTFEELNDCFFSLEVKCAKDFVLMKLTRKSYYSKEIEKMLKDAFVSQEAIHVVIEKCTMYGFINDALWIQSFIRKEQMLKHGRRLIANKLRQKYVPEENIIAFLNSGTASEQREQILKLLQTKYKARNLADFKEREKTVGAIMRRGYTYTEIKESIESLGYSGEEGCNL